ncbi:hypothetical protein BDZ90DRAFT_262366 [Jaminaea rosea]|uniref:DFDF domain-containing protein n=1 Tax=Jaminaea rosea TaxID=1569628 RepID=A0A316ULQ4_9BASI|nr:hypothetical protein BDZ90DRAFT_262366 [Jaminaea rosea]PWN25311.1 hypothetical protein BDZ90DRAFT_262366 [Jaminaea rosea]
MSSAYIGVAVAVTQSNGTTVSGTIVAIDAQRNLLFLQPQGSSRTTTINRNNIKSITTLANNNNNNAASSSQPKAVPPDAAKLPTPSAPSQPPPPRAPSKQRNKSKAAAAAKAANAAASPAPTPPPPAPEAMPDFDFEGALKGFDKARIWDEIRANDRIDPASRLVAHNRVQGTRANNGGNDNRDGSTPSSPAPRGRANGAGASSDKQRKLRPDENVLSPSPPPEGTQDVPAVASTASATGATGASANEKAIDGEQARLRRELRIAQRKLAVLESISGIRLAHRRNASEGIRDSTEIAAVLDFDCSIASPPPAPGAPSVTDSQRVVRFALSTTLDEGDAKLRFKPEGTPDGDQGDAPASVALPEKYRREMGLRMDNGSARVFLDRVRAATFS